MSIKNWNAGIIRPVPVAPAGPYQDGAAPGVWTLDQVAYWEKQDLWPTAGNLDPSLFIENLFSTYLYTGNGSTQTITNGIDLSGKGGLVWIKERSGNASHILFDSARGGDKRLSTNTTNAQGDLGGSGFSMASSGFTISTNSTLVNGSSLSYASWTFRKQAKFFDVVTYTGNGSNRTIAHNLGSVPGCIIVKRTDTTGDWQVYHRANTAAPETDYLVLNTTAATADSDTRWNDTLPTSTVFSLGTATDVNANTGTYVAYLFAHDAGGFGAAGTDNVISCGSFTPSAGAATITLGYEPQWILFKNSATGGDNWVIVDVMRNLSLTGQSFLYPNSSAAEVATSGWIAPTATGFQMLGSATNSQYIYIAIRRGPMRTPTSGTSVFSPVSTAGNVSSITAGFPVDLALGKEVKNTTSYGNYAIDRLRGGSVLLQANTTSAEVTSQTFKFDSNTQFLQSGAGVIYGPSVYWLMRRAPGFFDEVCYTGTGSATTITHNLASVPELMIVKTRSTVDFWYVYHKDVGNTKYLQLQSTAAPATSSVVWNNTTPTSSVFSVGVATNGSGVTHVAYLFSTVTGVSKVGSYTGTGTTSVKQVDCGFTGGARFVLIKRTDSTGDWYIWDSARGIVAGNDPYLLLNSTAAEVTTTDWVDTYSLGFELSTASGNNVNINNATYIFLAIA